MVTPTGTSLGERQRTINLAVNDAFKNKGKSELIYDNQLSDVDNMFYIDLASKNNNIQFIINIFRSGDDFAITRAANKATWICNKEHAHLINADYLEKNIFPYMSIKMKKKLLTKISIHLKDHSRIIDFYNLCIKQKFDNIKTKFLVKSPESHKLNQIAEYKVMIENKTHVKHLIANSNAVAVSYIESFSQPMERNKALYDLRYMFSKSEDEYLQTLETYYIQEPNEQNNIRFGLRLSKNIIKNHKSRILENPSLYMHILNTNIITKYSTRNEANIYAASVFPADVMSFWIRNYCHTYKYILELIDEGQRFSFVKRLFYEKYPNEQFEINLEFYRLKWHELIMTNNEKEMWALQHIESGMQLLGTGNDYIWYQFVNFDRALEDVHNLISTATDTNQKSEMLKTMIVAAKTPQEIQKLLNYYDNNHFDSVSTVHSVKVTERFLSEMFKLKEVMKFNEDCWQALEKLFKKLKVFESANNDEINAEYRVIALAYKIVNDREIPIIYNEFIENGLINLYTLAMYGEQLNSQVGLKVYRYIFNYYCDKIKKINAKNDSIAESKADSDLKDHVNHLLDLMVLYKKNKNDLPENIYRVINSEWEKFKYHGLFVTRQVFSEKHIKRYLKTESALVTSEFPKIKEYIEKRFGKIDWVIKKLRTYFSNDVAVTYSDKLETCLDNVHLSKAFAKVAVRGIIILADQPKKLRFLSKYSPSNPTLSNHGFIAKNILYIRHAISSQVFYSRPPMPLETISPYINEDVIHNCWPMLQHYVIYTPPQICVKFLELLLEKSFVIQKFGIRLALDYLDTENMKTFFTNIWKKRTCNSPLRVCLYKSILIKFLNTDTASQQELFDVLKYFTEDLNEGDDELFDEITETQLSENYMGEFLATCLRAASKLPEGDDNYQRMANIIRAIDRNMALISEEILHKITIYHINKMFDEKQILKSNSHYFEDLVKAMWSLIARNLSNVHTEPLLTKNIDILKTIINHCIGMWDEVNNEKYIIREFCLNFLNDIEVNSFVNNTVDYNNVSILLAAIIDQLNGTVPECTIYKLILNLRLSAEAIKILIEPEPSDINENDEQELAVAIITSIVTLGEVFGTIMKEYIERDKYYPLFIDEMRIAVNARMMILKGSLDKNNVFDIDHTDMQVYFCKGLLEYNIPEMYMFICKILPVECSELCLPELKKIIKAIKSFDNDEIQFYLYEKFVNNGFKNFIDNL